MRAIGYTIAVIGAIGVLLKTEMAKKIVGITLPAITQTNTFMIGSIIVVVIGLALAMMSPRGRGMGMGMGFGFRRGGGEVPIYHGNQIVGYRRV